MTDGFWDGTGGALIGTVGAALIALGTLFITRRLDRRLLRDQVGLDAATRLMDSGISLATLLERELGLHGLEYEEWIEKLLPRVHGFRRQVLLDVPLIPHRALRDALVLDADWLVGGFIDALGFAEGAAVAAHADVNAALNGVKTATHERFTRTLSDLNAWRASFSPRGRLISRQARRTLKSRPTPYWETLVDAPDDDGGG